jgi:hypothetical protein
MRPRNIRSINNDFRCKNCGYIVITNPEFCAVNNRNHCPYCLWSRHLDLFQAGDRLAACKDGMRPIGLTLKQAHKKYGCLQGELMLVHLCSGCSAVSINRIAADDDVELIFTIFESALTIDPELHSSLLNEGIRLLTTRDEKAVRRQLFGWREAPSQERVFA